MNCMIALLADREWAFFLNPGTLVFAIPIVAVLVGGIVALAKLLLRHRERMAMIERGMHPDYPAEPGDSQRPS